MDFLARDTVSFPEDFWEKIDNTVVNTVRTHIIGRRFLSLYGPLGAGVLSVNVDSTDTAEEAENGFVRTTGRKFVELPQIYEDFTLNWRDIEHSNSTGIPLDLTKVRQAAQKIALKEDSLIFFGNEFLGTEGLLTAEGAVKMQKSDWTVGDNAFRDIAAGLARFRSKFMIGRYSLVLSPDLYVQLQHINPGLGIMEEERISKMLNGHLYNAPVLGSNKAVLVCAEPQYMDLAVGKDIQTAYLESKDLNHVFRILETAALRIKNREAIIIFE